MSVDYVTFSNLIVDDIVLSDGTTFMNTLGGSGTHALVGMRVWNSDLGFMATVGRDLDLMHRAALERFGIDLEGMIVREGYRTARAWQLFEPEDLRVEIFRTDIDNFRQNEPKLAELPESYRGAKGFHIQWGTLPEVAELVDGLRAMNPAVALVMEPTYVHSEQVHLFQLILPQLALFSPDATDGLTITGRSDPREMISALLELGAPRVALRMGARGSLVGTREGEWWRIPAIPTQIVDVTGAGNAYCGGFLTGLGDGLDTLEAALRAAVSASFAIEQFGLPMWAAGQPEAAARRLAWARERIETLDDGRWTTDSDR